jgi:hypothetical protein
MRKLARRKYRGYFDILWFDSKYHTQDSQVPTLARVVMHLFKIETDNVIRVYFSKFLKGNPGWDIQ